MGKSSKNKVAVANPNAGHGRTVMIIIIVAVVLALILVGVAIMTKKQAAVTQPDGTIPGTKTATGYAEPQEFSQGKGLWFKSGKLLSNAEIQKETEAGTKVLEYYFDYTCNICNDYDEKLGNGKQLDDLVEGGKALVVLRPTLTHALPFAPVANNLILWTAENAPDKTWAVQKDLAAYALQNYKSADYEKNQGNEKWTNEAQNPLPVVQKIAEKNGIDFAKVPPAAQDAGGLAINIYAQQRMTGLGRDQAGTPLYIANGKIVDLANLGKDDKLLEKATL